MWQRCIVNPYGTATTSEFAILILTFIVFLCDTLILWILFLKPLFSIWSFETTATGNFSMIRRLSQYQKKPKSIEFFFQFQLFLLQKSKAQFFHLGLNQNPRTCERAFYKKSVTIPMVQNFRKVLSLSIYLDIRTLLISNYRFDFFRQVLNQNSHICGRRFVEKLFVPFHVSSSWLAECLPKS